MAARPLPRQLKHAAAGFAQKNGTPLARPYLHFAYNYLVVVPMVLANRRRAF